MNADPVLDALEEQVVCYRRLAKLAELQHEHVRQSRTEELLAVLGQRQQVLDQVAVLEQSILPVKRRWSDYLGGLAEQERGKAQGLMAESRQLLEQITTADRNDAMVLQQRKLDVAASLRQTAAARRVSRVYATTAYGSGVGGMDLRK